MKTIFFHFRSVSNSLSAIVFFPSTWLLNLLSTCPWVLFRGKYFFLRNIFSFSLNFRTLSEELLVFRREVFSRFFKTEFQVHTRTIWGFFSEKPCFKTSCGQWKEICSILSRSFWRNCQNCILILHGITLREIIFLIVGFSLHFRLLSKKNSLLWKSSNQV